MERILIIAGTRPNFIKITRFKKVNASMGNPFEIKIVHTGQHYDDKMANIFFDQFELEPDYWLNIPSDSPNTQMAEIMLRLEPVIEQFNPSVTMVPGDVNSTFAAALTCNKMNRKLAHIESGLRSYDRTMPEEINRILTDEISDYCFITEQSGYDNLLKEGKNSEQLFFAGNTMIDTLVAFEDKIQSDKILDELDLKSGKFVLMTMHRPATVDNLAGLNKLIEIIEFICQDFKVVFPIHPRTLNRIELFGMDGKIKSLKELILTEPLGYFAFQKLVASCKMVLTDSGGIQEETTFRKVPCLTLRANTERPSTVSLGTNELIPFDLEIIRKYVETINCGTYKKGKIPPCWDGKSTKRILESLVKIFSR